MFKRLLALAAALVLGLQPAAAATVGPLPYTLVNGQPADAGQVMANFNKIVNDVNNNVIFPSFTQQGYYAVATGTANALIVGISPAPANYAPGMVLNVKIATTNTGAATINANSLGVVNVVNPNGAALRSQQMIAGMVATMIYDGSQFQLQTLSPLAARQLTVGRTIALFTTPGAWTLTVPVGVYALKLEAWGAGGGGGGGNGAGAYAGGGSSGAYGLMQLSVLPGDVISGSVGAGGVAGTSAPTSGGAGNTTTILINGVLTGSATGGGGGGAASSCCAAGGTGPTVTGTWGLSITGQNGGSGLSGSQVGGQGGYAPRGGVGGNFVSAVGCANGGSPGGGGSGAFGTAVGCPGGNGWVYIEY